jgi:hypothetical protein
MGTARTCAFEAVMAYLSSEIYRPTYSIDTSYRRIKIMFMF